MRRPRWSWVAGAALAAAVGGSAVAWSVIADDPDDADDPAPAVTRVLTAEDAEAASAATSRRIRRELAGNVRTVGVPWASDTEARVIIGARSDPTSVEVVDPRTGDRTPLPTLWKGHPVSASSVRFTQRAVWVSWVDRVEGVHRPVVMRYDVGTGRHELVLAPEVPHHRRANFTSALAMGDDGRFYFRTFRAGHDGPAKFPQLWSFDPASPDDARREGKAPGWTVAGSLLATLASDDPGGAVILQVRDLTTGEEHHHTFASCDDPHLEASSAFVVVACDESEVLVLDRTATPLARLRVSERVNVDGFGPPSLRVGHHWISVGRLAYRPATGRLLRLREPTTGP